jgi:hypothetical protein
VGASGSRMAGYPSVLPIFYPFSAAFSQVYLSTFGGFLATFFFTFPRNDSTTLISVLGFFFFSKIISRLYLKVIDKGEVFTAV